MNTPRFEYYQGHDKLWYWHLRDGNGKLVADGGEGYVTRANVRRAILNIMDTVPDATAEERPKAKKLTHA